MKKVDRKIILLQYSFEKVENAAGIVLLQDAIDAGEVLLAATPNEYRTKEFIDAHNRKVRSGEGADEDLYRLYLHGVELDKKEKYILLINEVHYAMWNRFFFEYLKQFDVKIVLICRNMIMNKKKPMLGAFSVSEVYDYFDLVITDEPTDAEKFGFLYYPDTFCRPDVEEQEVVYDLCFSGADKERAGMVYQIYLAAQEKGVKCDFRLVDEKKHYLPGITYIDWLPYREIIRQDLTSGCILEVLQMGQDGYSLRQEEAVVLGKKLLTNNPRAKESKFYKTGNIQYFSKVDDIDFDFVLKRESVDYNYQGEYSGITFVQNVVKILGQKE